MSTREPVLDGAWDHEHTPLWCPVPSCMAIYSRTRIPAWQAWFALPFVRLRPSTALAWAGGILAASYWSGHLAQVIDWAWWNVWVLGLERHAELVWRAW